MAKKYTKRQINADIAKIQAELAEATNKRSLMTKQADAGIEFTTEQWNTLHDLIDYELPRKIKDIEHKFDTQDWTLADWRQRDLVTSNID